MEDEKGRRVVSWEVGKGGRVVRRQGGKGGRVLRWQVGKGGRVASWQGEKCGRVVRWQAGTFLVLFKGGRRRVSPGFHLFVFDVNQQNEGAGWVQDILARPQGWKNCP